MPKTLKPASWTNKVRAGDWVAFRKDSRDHAVAVARTFEAAVRKVRELGEEDNVVFSQVPPRDCALIL